jgi:hypothetical protein
MHNPAAAEHGRGRRTEMGGQVLKAAERWVGPFQIRRLLESCLDPSAARPPETGSAYLVTKFGWQAEPTQECVPLYVGGTTGNSLRFRTRIGDLIADAFGFFTSATGHHSGGQHIREWTLTNQVSPLELYISWIEGTACPRCLEIRLHRELKPILNRNAPSRCIEHGSFDCRVTAL